MATISSGSVTFTINAGEQYRVIATGEAYVDIGGGATTSYRLTGPTNERVLGSFIVATPVTIRIVSGIAEYFNITGAGDQSVFPDNVNNYTKAQRGQIVNIIPVSNVYTPDASAGNFFSFTPTANFTLANPTNMPVTGVTQSGSFFVTQDETGSRAVTFGNLYQAAGGISTITLSTGANVKDRIDYVIGAAGNIHVSIAKDVKA